jgi:hypothetical protein
MIKKKLLAAKTGEKAKPMWGSAPYQVRARRALPLLVESAKSRRTVSYTDFAHRLRMGNPRNVNFVLGSVGVSLEYLS